MLRPDPEKPTEWFVDGALPEKLVGIPGWKVDGRGRFRIPRNLLPLLDADPQVVKLIAGLNAGARMTWTERKKRDAAKGFELRTTQNQAIDFIQRRRGTLIGDDMRLGKGHPKDTKVLTPDGWRAIGSLRLGDQVVGSDGGFTQVTGVYDRGWLPIFNVLFTDGSRIKVDGEHLWKVWDHNAWHRGGAAKVLPTQVLAEDLTYANGNRKWRIPMVQPIEFETKMLPIDPYLLGVLLGDGCLSNGAVVFVPGDEDVPREVARVLPVGDELHRRPQKKRATVWSIVGVKTRAALRNYSLLGSKAETKRVPEQFLYASVAQRLALLQGLMDTDGELWKNGVVGFSSASRELADAVQFLVESLGGSARYHYKAEPKYTYRREKRVGQPSHRLTIAMPAGFSPFRARAGYTERVKYRPARTIAAIAPAGSAEVVCISVAAEDRLYVTERCIVTHNTLTGLCAHDPKDGQLAIVAPLSARAVWLGWAKRVFPDTPIGVCLGKKLDREVLDLPIIFIHYEIIRYWNILRRFGTVIFDEAHHLGNIKTKRMTAACTMASWAHRVIALTGTPIWNMPEDLWSLISLLAQGAWGSFYDFANRYAAPESTAYGTRWTGSSNEAELKLRLSEVMLRRKWVDCVDDLPAISRSVLVAEVDQRTSNKLDIIAAKIKSESRSNAAGNLAAYRRQLTGVKLKTVVDEARKVMSRGEPVVVWTWHKEFAEAIANELGTNSVDGAPKTAYLMHGDIVADKREAIMAAWKTQPHAALVATMSVGQVAIDLSHARIAIFGEVDWTPAVIAQAEMRTFSPLRGMDIIFVVAAHVIDQRLVRALVSKLGAQDSLGVGAACDAIDALRSAVMGAEEVGDLDRLMESMLEAA